MKRIRIVIVLLVLLMLSGCGSRADIPFSDSKAPPDMAVASEQKDYAAVSEVFSQEVTTENDKVPDTGKPEVKPVEPDDASDSKKPEPEDERLGAAADSSSQVVNDPAEEAVSEENGHGSDPAEQEPAIESEPVSESESEPEDETTQPVDLPPEETEEESDPVSEVEAEEESESQPITEPEPVFDIEYWIGYARNTAAGLGLEFDSSAVDCWDNPITANPDCIYLERDITARLSRYAGDEDITAVWIWYESVGTNMYLIYIGYA